MKVLFDSSVLIPLFFESLLDHRASLEVWLQSPDNVLAAHSLAEFYANATRIPLRPRPSPGEVRDFVEQLTQRSTVVALTEEDYIGAVSQFAAQGHVGGLIYDFLIALCALKARADIICTWDAADFRRLSPEIAAKVKTPEELLRA